MNLTILGAGGTGALIGAYAKKGGLPVSFVDPYAAHMEAVSKNGLKMAINGKTEVVHVDKATTKAAEVGVSDAVIVLCKGQNNRETIKANMELFGPETLVITFQNGVGNVDVLEEFFPRDNIGFGVVRVAAMLKDPGEIINGIVHEPPVIDIHFGSAFHSTKHAEKYKILEEAFVKGGLGCEYTENTEKEIWIKMFSNVLFNMPCGICRIPMGPMISHPKGDELLKHLGHEVVDVANAKGLDLDFDSLWAFFDIFRKSKHYPSAAQDVMKKRSTEVELLNGAVVREGRKYGVPTPYNDAVYLMSKVIEDTYDLQF